MERGQKGKKKENTWSLFLNGPVFFLATVYTFPTDVSGCRGHLEVVMIHFPFARCCLEDGETGVWHRHQ